MSELDVATGLDLDNIGAFFRMPRAGAEPDQTYRERIQAEIARERGDAGFDPYKELGLKRTATSKEINAAFRKRVKETHPDKPTGSEEAFQATKRALAVLEDPRKRRKFDQTGIAADEEEPDNTRAAALHVIESFISSALDGYLNTGENDPRRRDLFREFISQTLTEIEDLRTEIKRGRGVKEFVRDVMQRVSSDDPANPVTRMLEDRIRNGDRTIAEVEEAIDIREMAVAIATRHRFDTSPELDIVKPVYRSER